MRTSYYDVVDENDMPTGKIASYDEVHASAIWYRAVHVIVYTPDKEIVMQKRAASLKYHPDEIEVSVGGGVDAGETPAQAVLREIREELGINLSEKDLRFIDKTKFNHRTKTQYHCNYLYSYAACIPRSKLNISSNPEETSSVFLISERKLRRALIKHRIKNFGKISSRYSYWRHLIDAM